MVENQFPRPWNWVAKAQRDAAEGYFAGQCIGGPYDGKCWANHSSSFDILEPAILGTMNILSSDPVITSHTVGRYVWNVFGCFWNWEKP